MLLYAYILCRYMLFLARAHHFSFPTLTTRSFSHEFMNIFIHTYNSLPSSSEHRRSRVCRASNNNVWYIFFWEIFVHDVGRQKTHIAVRESRNYREESVGKNTVNFLWEILFPTTIFFRVLVVRSLHCIERSRARRGRERGESEHFESRVDYSEIRLNHRVSSVGEWKEIFIFTNAQRHQSWWCWFFNSSFHSNDVVDCHSSSSAWVGRLWRGKVQCSAAA